MGQARGDVDTHEIKGSAFVTLSRWLRDHTDPDRQAEFWLALADAAEPVRHAVAGQWFPETLHHEVLRALAATIAEGDLDRYEATIHACTLAGVQVFANLLLSMSSPAFVLRRTPTLYAVIRRGPATLTVEQSPGSSLLRYRQFPFFVDPLYRHYFRALLGAVVEPALGRTPPVELLDHGADWLDVRVGHG